ncbi:hypothetical protein DL237_09305, partial [Pseudooceanicola sediminis]
MGRFDEGAVTRQCARGEKPGIRHRCRYRARQGGQALGITRFARRYQGGIRAVTERYFFTLWLAPRPRGRGRRVVPRRISRQTIGRHRNRETRQGEHRRGKSAGGGPAGGRPAKGGPAGGGPARPTTPLQHARNTHAPDPQTLRPSDPQTLRPSDPQTLRPSDPQTLRPS